MSAKVQQQKTVCRRFFEGVAVSDAREKTVRVRVDRTVVHPKYKKRYQQSATFCVHDPKNVVKAGDKVRFVECRPISKMKRWMIARLAA